VCSKLQSKIWILIIAIERRSYENNIYVVDSFYFED